MENLMIDSKQSQESNEILTNIAKKFLDKKERAEKNKKNTKTLDTSNWQEWL